MVDFGNNWNKVLEGEFQKEYYLREQLKVIQKELGDDDNINSEVDEYREKLNIKITIKPRPNKNRQKCNMIYWFYENNKPCKC